MQITHLHHQAPDVQFGIGKIRCFCVCVRTESESRPRTSRQHSTADLPFHLDVWQVFPSCVSVLMFRILGSRGRSRLTAFKQLLLVVEGDAFTRNCEGWHFLASSRVCVCACVFLAERQTSDPKFHFRRLPKKTKQRRSGKCLGKPGVCGAD